jgi:hypothetical protein
VRKRGGGHGEYRERRGEQYQPDDARGVERQPREHRPQRQRRRRSGKRQQFVARRIDAGDRPLRLPDVARPWIAAGVPGCAGGIIRFEIARERTDRRWRPEGGGGQHR